MCIRDSTHTHIHTQTHTHTHTHTHTRTVVSVSQGSWSYFLTKNRNVVRRAASRSVQYDNIIIIIIIIIIIVMEHYHVRHTSSTFLLRIKSSCSLARACSRLQETECRKWTSSVLGFPTLETGARVLCNYFVVLLCWWELVYLCNYRRGNEAKLQPICDDNNLLLLCP